MKTKSGVSLGISLPYSFPDARVDHTYIRRFVRHAESLGFDDGWLTEGLLNPNFVPKPPTNSNPISAQQQPTQYRPCRNPTPSEPTGSRRKPP